ncbi:MAG: hypothetical protein K8H88_07940 [Sandaracinaceae bacterium]|nr:hypothetical protein [Sandaracinaceae bacterium]
MDALRRDLDESRNEASLLRERLAVYEKRPSLPGKRPLLTIVAPVALILLSFAGAVGFLLVTASRPAAPSPAPAVVHAPMPAPISAPAPHGRWSGQVVSTSAGEPPVPMDAACEVRLADLGSECRLAVRCAERELYAVDDGHGFFDCARFYGAVADTQVDARTDDGDPMLSVDWSRDRIRVQNDGWFVDVQITAPTH